MAHMDKQVHHLKAEASCSETRVMLREFPMAQFELEPEIVSESSVFTYFRLERYKMAVFSMTPTTLTSCLQW